MTMRDPITGIKIRNSFLNGKKISNEDLDCYFNDYDEEDDDD